MGGLGALLLMGGGVWAALLWCFRGRERLDTAVALRRQLAEVKRGVLVVRMPLGELTRALAEEGGGTAPFWETLHGTLGAEQPFSLCWQRALERLPKPCGEILVPLGTVLTTGEEEAEELLREAEEELSLYIRGQRRERQQRERLAVALGLCAGAMAALAML